MSIWIVAQILYVICPKCGEHIEGFVGDPRGAGEEGEPGVVCEYCNHEFVIPHDEEVDLQ